MNLKMGSTNPFKEQPGLFSLTRKLLPWTLYALLIVALIRLYFYPIPPSLSTTNQFQLPQNSSILITPSSSSLAKEKERANNVEMVCDYSKGEWVPDKSRPLYNGSSCGTIKDGQNCMGHGRPDLGFLYWRWRPSQCKLRRFDPTAFLRLISHKHLAFVGDSMARNQLESLLCMLTTASSPVALYGGGEEKFRRWRFPSYNATVSVYWSPFLVKGTEKSETEYLNRLHFDDVDERWASDLDQIDVIVLSVGHWFLHPAVYYDGGSVLGCHACSGENYTEIGFYDVFAKAFRTTLNVIIKNRSKNGIDVIVTTFSPHHFEGDWDKFGACPKTRPYKPGEKKLEGMDFEMRKAQVAEVEAAYKSEARKLAGVRMKALDVTELSLMRPDGHPGPYMYPNPFADGIKERVQNDCVHWCLPGPVDTWNAILLDVMRRWERQSWRAG
ncbi:hypothetical protein NMG60_11008973 [Bertholletia excelsa]